MRKNVNLCRLFLMGCLLLTCGLGCAGLGRDKAGPRETPQQTMDVFRKALETRDYSTAYHCLSKNAKSRYQFNHFKMMFEWTVFGILIKNMVVSWETESIKYSHARQEARLTLRHQYYPTYKKTFFFVYENEGWRVDFTLARILGMPQEDEDLLFPPQPVKETKPGKEPGAPTQPEDKINNHQ